VLRRMPETCSTIDMPANRRGFIIFYVKVYVPPEQTDLSHAAWIPHEGGRLVVVNVTLPGWCRYLRRNTLRYCALYWHEVNRMISVGKFQVAGYIS
ncbi:MAG: hypothetical protein WBO57_02290, partial [Gammaproteobacteria bacterium]